MLPTEVEEAIYSSIDYTSPRRYITSEKFEDVNLLGFGSSRLCLKDDDTVYKIGVGRDGIIQNYVEYNIWQILVSRASVNKAKEIVAPVHFVTDGYRCLEMDFVSVIEEPMGDSSSTLKIKSQLGDYGIYVDDVGIGKLSGQTVAFDFGQVETIKKRDKF